MYIIFEFIKISFLHLFSLKIKNGFIIWLFLFKEVFNINIIKILNMVKKSEKKKQNLGDNFYRI